MGALKGHAGGFRMPESAPCDPFASPFCAFGRKKQIEEGGNRQIRAENAKKCQKMYKIRRKSDKNLFTFYKICGIIKVPLIENLSMGLKEQQEVITWLKKK